MLLKLLFSFTHTVLIVVLHANSVNIVLLVVQVNNAIIACCALVFCQPDGVSMCEGSLFMVVVLLLIIIALSAAVSYAALWLLHISSVVDIELIVVSETVVISVITIPRAFVEKIRNDVVVPMCLAQAVVVCRILLPTAAINLILLSVLLTLSAEFAHTPLDKENQRKCRR